jgi:hypothetical protein
VIPVYVVTPIRFSWRWDDLELRSCNQSLLQDGEHTTAEVVRWLASGGCIAIAAWVHTSDGNHELRFVGDRPFQVDAARFMEMAKHGHEMLRRTELGR